MTTETRLPRRRRLQFAIVFTALLAACTPPTGPLTSEPPTPEEAGLQDLYVYPGVTPVPLPSQDAVFGGAHLNPFLYAERNGIHDNPYNTDVSDLDGPDLLGTVDVATRRLDWLLNACPSVLYTADGNIVTVCLSLGSVTLHLLDPDTLETLDSEELPPKGNASLDPSQTDASGGGYLHILSNGDLMVAPYDKTVRVYSFPQDPQTGENSIELSSSFDLSPFLPEDANITDAVPDFDGNIWFSTATGIIGFKTPSDDIVLEDLGVDLQNQIGMDADHVFFSTFERFYKARASAALDDIEIVHSVEYDNSAGGGSGVLSPGTGTTPTLFGQNDDLVAIADNAAPQMHLNIYRRSDLSLVCSHPVFDPEAGAAENSPIGYGNSIAIQNSRGWGGFLGDPLALIAGFQKVTAVPDGNGGFSGCVTDWYTTDISSSSTPLLSTASGKIYTISVKEGSGGEAAHYLAEVDWVTGDLIAEKWIGNGAIYDPVLTGGGISEHDGTFAFPTRQGMVRVKNP